VTISALDTRGLYTTNMDASKRGVASMRDLMTGEMAEYHSETMNLSEDVMAEFANGSGGKFFHNNNELEGGFKELTQAPEYLYILEMSLDKVKSDGTYHRLKVKVDGDALKVEARRGYFAPRAVKKKK
jgi:VWFA-related protein